MDFSTSLLFTGFQRKVTITQGAEPRQPPHGGVWDILSNWSTTCLPL